MIGELTTKKSELGASPLFMTLDRISEIDYIVCTSKTRSKFVFRSPKLSYTENVFLLPFDTYVWVSLISMSVIASLVLFVSANIEWKTMLNVHVYPTKDEKVLQPSLRECIFLLYCAFCQQGSTFMPCSLGSRLITLVSFVALMFMYSSYSANIVALLQSPSNKIRSLEDLYNSRLSLGVDDTVFNHYYFSHAEGVRRKIYEDKIIQKSGFENFLNLSDGVRKIRDELFAFHMEVGVGYKILQEIFEEHDKCGLQEIAYLQVVDPYYAIQKNSSYKEIFKNALLRMKEFGLHDRENSKLYTKRPKCGTHGGGKFISVGIVDIEPAIKIFLIGLTIGISIFILEKIHFWLSKFKAFNTFFKK